MGDGVNCYDADECLVIMTVARTHNALMSKEHMAANVSLVILVTLLSVPRATSGRLP